ncbi:MAG: hypothetical protein HQL11_00220 [Candidatus Omnitrophica bacterium]|nr:hypothetical protein [Candidatus Omnitrophota bacterium]
MSLIMIGQRTKRWFRRMTVALLCVQMLIVCPGTASPADESMGFIQGIEERVSIDLRDSDVVEVLTFLAKKGKFNIYFSPNVTGRVTLHLTDVRIADILDIVLLSNSLAHVQRGPVVYIMTMQEYTARYGVSYDDEREVRIHRLQYASTEQVFKMLDAAKSDVGSVVADQKTGTLFLVDIPAKINVMTDIIAELDQPLEKEIFDLDYAKAEDMQALLASAGVQEAAELTADIRSNQIVVSALPERMKEIRHLVATLDRKTREVVIDTMIVKVILSDDYDQGIDWQKIFTDKLESLNLQGLFSRSLGTGGLVTFAGLTTDYFEVVFEFLKTLGESKILANPRITVVEGQEAKILIGTREAYVTSTTTTGSSTSTTAEDVSFIDVGISLYVTPQINKNGFVTMAVKPEISSVARTLTTPSNNEIPIVDTTEVETKISVKDGTTVMIGGLRKTENTSTIRKLPFFGDLPFFKEFFRSEETDTEEFELILFMTPHIIGGEANYIHDRPSAVGDYREYLSKSERITAEEDVVIEVEDLGPVKGLQDYSTLSLPAQPAASAQSPKAEAPSNETTQPVQSAVAAPLPPAGTKLPQDVTPDIDKIAKGLQAYPQESAPKAGGGV